MTQRGRSAWRGWRPTPEYIANANATRLLRRSGLDKWQELAYRASEDADWFWPLIIDDMSLEFDKRWEKVVDLSRSPEWATWFVGGRLNIAWNCVHCWAERRPTAVAVVECREDGDRRELTFRELSRSVTKLAEALVRLGVKKGDRVALFLPMSADVVVASHAVAHIGAVQVPIFSGFAALHSHSASPRHARASSLRRDRLPAAVARSPCLRRPRRLPARLPLSSTSSSAVR